MFQEVELLRELNHGPIAFVEEVPHQPGEFHDALFGFFGINVHERVDIVEGVHEKVRIDLVAKRFQLALDSFRFHSLQFLLPSQVVEEGLETEVGDDDEDADENPHQRRVQRSRSIGRPAGTVRPEGESFVRAGPMRGHSRSARASGMAPSDRKAESRVNAQQCQRQADVQPLPPLQQRRERKFMDKEKQQEREHLQPVFRHHGPGKSQVTVPGDMEISDHGHQGEEQGPDETVQPEFLFTIRIHTPQKYTFFSQPASFSLRKKARSLNRFSRGGEID